MPDIARIVIEVEPHYDWPNMKTLRISLRTSDGVEHSMKMHYPVNDFISFFDEIWHRAGDLLKKSLGA